MRTKLVFISLLTLILAVSCNQEKLSTYEQEKTLYHFVDDGVDIRIAQLDTRAEDGLDEYLLEASYLGMVSKTRIEVTSIDETTSFVEHLSQDGLLIASMMIVDDRLVSLDFNEDATDEYLGLPQTRSLGSYIRCIGERYKQLREVIDSDGVLMIMCDVLIAVCPAEMATASAIKCLMD